jgi:hypothetical protein
LKKGVMEKDKIGDIWKLGGEFEEGHHENSELD